MAAYPDVSDENSCAASWPQQVHCSHSQSSRHRTCDNRIRATVLIVEDDPANLQLAIYCMEMAGYHTIAASDGEQAVHLALAHKPDLVLMDIRIPVLSGYDAIELIKRNSATSKIGIIAVTAMATAEEKQWIKASGCSDYLEKPYLIETLLERVAALLSQQRT